MLKARRFDSEDRMYLRKVEDFHRPNLMISWSEKPRLAAWVAAPILNEWVLKFAARPSERIVSLSLSRNHLAFMPTPFLKTRSGADEVVIGRTLKNTDNHLTGHGETSCSEI